MAAKHKLGEHLSVALLQSVFLFQCLKYSCFLNGNDLKIYLNYVKAKFS